MTWLRRIALAATALAVAGACGSVHRATPPAADPQPVVYAALGASETVGVGTANPGRDAFPQQLYQRFPRSAVLYNFALPGETTAAALNEELPQALTVRPTLVTVWFGVDDLVAGVPAADYEARLDRLVGAMRRHGAATVLVANGPPLDRLPAYAACRPDPPAAPSRCPFGSVTLPSSDAMSAEVAAYEAATARVAARQGAILVDVAGQAEVADQHPEYVSADGLHPTAKGATAIANAFAASLDRAQAQWQ